MSLREALPKIVTGTLTGTKRPRQSWTEEQRLFLTVSELLTKQ